MCPVQSVRGPKMESVASYLKHSKFFIRFFLKFQSLEITGFALILELENRHKNLLFIINWLRYLGKICVVFFFLIFEYLKEKLM